MIQIDIEMPKCCDVCMFSDWSNLVQTASCKLKEYEPCFDRFSDEYRSKRADFCPLHEVTADTDTVSRQAVLDAVEKCHTQCCRQDSTGDEWVHYDTIRNEMECLPPSPRRPHGHWIKISPANIYECSECGKNVMTGDISAYDFCHGCGADMREPEDIPMEYFESGGR